MAIKPPVQQILDNAKLACNAHTDSALATALQVTRSAVSSWRVGRAYPDEVVCSRIAALTGMKLGKVLGIVGEARAISSDAKRVWRQLAAAAILLTPLLSYASPTKQLDSEPMRPVLSVQSIDYAK